MDNSNNKGDAVFNDIDEVLAKKIAKRAEVNNAGHDDALSPKRDGKKGPQEPEKKMGWKVPVALFALGLMVVAVYRLFKSDEP